MKKYFLVLVLVTLLSVQLSASAWNFCFWKKNTTPELAQGKNKEVKRPDFEIVATMDSDSNAKNVVWVGTFQLVWNDLIDEIVKNPVEFVGFKSTLANRLNKKDFTVENLKDSSYYTKIGYKTYKVKKEIEKALKDKFDEKSDILDKFSWANESKEYILYAMLKKDFEYLKTFDKLPDGEFKGSSGKVQYFGIDSDSSSALRRTVSVLFYNNSNDFAIMLQSKQGDNVYLYRTDDDKNLALLYDDMISKSNKYMGIRTFGKKDEFMAPMLDFKKERSFDELCGKPIKNTDFIINGALETVQFKMNESGVKLKSEAAIIVGCTCCPDFRDEPRYFYCNGKYVIFLQEKDKPYFAMKIEDARTLQKK